MKILARTHFGNPILRKKAKKVSVAFLKTPKFKKLEREMIHTMRRVDGIGLAAPQIGQPFALAVMETGPTKTRPNIKVRGPITIINPKIISYSKEKKREWEGCLSFEDVRGNVSRPKSITVSYLNNKGEKIREKAEGLWARLFQHEIDHLNGIVYLDRMEDMKSIMTLQEFKKRIVSKKLKKLKKVKRR